MDHDNFLNLGCLQQGFTHANGWLFLFKQNLHQLGPMCCLIVYWSPQLRAWWCRFHSLAWAVVGVFSQQKLPKAIDQKFHGHLPLAALTANCEKLVGTVLCYLVVILLCGAHWKKQTLPPSSKISEQIVLDMLPFYHSVRETWIRVLSWYLANTVT